MSDIKLTRPAVAATATIEPNKGDNFTIAFDPSEAVMSQQDGSLVFTFEDGAQLVVANFYGVYSKDEAPSFSFEDTVFTAQEFFGRVNGLQLFFGQCFPVRDSCCQARLGRFLPNAASGIC